MATPNIGNRLARQGRGNPGREHLSGSDVSGKMQRQYEHILQSLRDYRKFRSDAKRKQVAAATVRKLQQNPASLKSLFRNLGLDEEGQAERLAEEFHGREVRDIIDVTEVESYDENGAVLGYLVELCILTEDGEAEIPIRFPYHPESKSNVLVVSNPAGTNLEFVGGDQDIDWRSVEGASVDDKYLVSVGPVSEIVYWADKHHLSGPKSQADGMEYYHEFGEEDGELPYLVFDRRNTKLLLVGGNYTVEPEGITG
jgi:hypothetical protein